MKQWTRKGVARGLLVAAALLFVVAKAQPAAAPATQAPAAGQPRIGGTLKFGIVKDIGTPIPFVAYTSISQYVKDNVYEPLVMFDQKGEIHPWLAESWTPNANSSEWTFKIRRGVKFHDGKELTANDVVWSAKHIMDPANGAAGQGQLSSMVRDAVALDNYTVKFISPSPRGLLPEILADTTRRRAPAPSSSRRGSPGRNMKLFAITTTGAALHTSTVFASASSSNRRRGPRPSRQGISI